MASASGVLRSIFLASAIFLSATNALNASSSSSSNSVDVRLSEIKTFCKATPYPDACADSLKLSISISISPDILTFLLQTLDAAVSEATKLSALLGSSRAGVVEHRKGALEDCQELQQITVSSLQRSVSRARAGDTRKLSDARTYLSAALTNKATCLEGLSSASGPGKLALVSFIHDTYKHVRNSLSILARSAGGHSASGRKGRRLGGFPEWVSEKARRVLEEDEYDPSDIITVAADGSGNFTTVSDAISFAPNNSYDRTIIYIREGVYEEYVNIPQNKTNIVLLGDGAGVTVVTGSRSFADGWTTFRSATVGKSHRLVCFCSRRQLTFR
ncbi:hypothetical protein SAY86_003088 [Trapa natans]|uniref:Pectinesterase inhibitor domain-containing protein n=1 Tax=Trapa natans TaxID=22666 RepID=A0AAN7LK92_TRANT|nr:hypothetical protein SAY86_003088 [Trapa natans]